MFNWKPKFSHNSNQKRTITSRKNPEVIKKTFNSFTKSIFPHKVHGDIYISIPTTLLKNHASSISPESRINCTIVCFFLQTYIFFNQKFLWMSTMKLWKPAEKYFFGRPKRFSRTVRQFWQNYEFIEKQKPKKIHSTPKIEILKR